MDFLVPPLCLHKSIKCTIALCLKKLICKPYLKNSLLIKSAHHHLSSQQAVLFLLMEGLASVLMAAEGWGDWQFLKIRQ